MRKVFFVLLGFTGAALATKRVYDRKKKEEEWATIPPRDYVV